MQRTGIIACKVSDWNDEYATSWPPNPVLRIVISRADHRRQMFTWVTVSVTVSTNYNSVS